MRDFIADKELSDTQALQENDSITESVGAANDDEHQEEKKKRTYKKGATLRLDGPVAGLCSLEKGAAYIGLTKAALRVALQRNQMPGHKTRSNPEDENSDGVWWFNAREWDKLADELPECEPPEWHNWKSYWTYDRQKRKFSPANKKDCQTINGKRVYTGRKSKLEQHQYSEGNQ